MFTFKPPLWCKIQNNSIKEAVLKAAENVGAQIYMSASLTWNIEDFEIVNNYFKKFGKTELAAHVVEYCKEKLVQAKG